MPIFRTPYNTAFGSSIKINDIEKGLVSYIAREPYNLSRGLFNEHMEVTPVALTGYSGAEAAVPFFGHPFPFEHRGHKYLGIDLRQYVKTGNRGDEPEFRNIAEFTLIKNRAALSLAWLCGSVSTMRTGLSSAGIVFATWIGEAISKRFALNPAEQVYINVCAFVYYDMLFRDETKFTEDDKYRYEAMLTKNMRIPSQVVSDILGVLIDQEYTGIASLVNHIKLVVQNIRLSELNQVSFQTVLANSWFMTNAKEMIVIALEHPPTWLMICDAALNERTYRNSSIAKIAERVIKGTLLTEFKFNFSELTRVHLATEEIDLATAVGTFE